MNAQFSFSDIWNSSLIRESRPLEIRDYIYATELQSSLCDTWLKMKATPFSNVPNERSERKFMMGEIIEWLAGLILIRSGIMKSNQERIQTNFDIRVSGRLDYVAGDTADYAAAEDAINKMMLPEKMHNMSMKILETFKARYGYLEFETSPIEIKSCSSYTFEKVSSEKQPLLSHEFQALHYAIGGGYSHSKLVYISKDDGLMEEFNIWASPENIKKYKDRVAYVASVLKSDTMPKKESLITLDKGKFGKSLQVEWSNYLTMLYSFDTPQDYRDSLGGSIERWNRVVSRFASGQKITTKNEDVKKEIIAAGYDFNKIVEERKRYGGFEESVD